MCEMVCILTSSSPQNISAKEINCADCLQKPKVWAQNPVCTADLRVFDPLVSSVFQRIERKPTDYEFYLIDDKLKQTTLCQGCKGLKEFFYQPFIVVSHFSKSIEVICKPCNCPIKFRLCNRRWTV